MRRLIAALALLSAPVLAADTLPALNPAQEAALHCSAVFAVIAADQAKQGPGSLPSLEQRGREFFVLTTARLMDETGASRGQVAALFGARVDQVRTDTASAATKFAACQPMLDAEVPSTR